MTTAAIPSPRPVTGTLAQALTRVPAEFAVLAVGIVARLIPVVRFGSFNGYDGYDAAVYYAGSSALIDGRMPYRDFVLLHPPGILLADAPFAVIGRLTSDHIGYTSAVLAAIVTGGVNAVLVMRIARRMGLDRRAAIVGGLVYALWFGSIAAEYVPRLEPLGNLLVLLGVLALLAAHQNSPSRVQRWLLPLASGAAFGAALSVKLWWIVPLGVLVGWLLVVRRSVRVPLLGIAGAALAVLTIDGPFLLAAGSRMPTMVITDQLGRTANNTGPLRLLRYLAVGDVGTTAPTAVALAVIAVAAVVLAGLCIRAWRHRLGRVAVVILVVQLLQLGVEPSWFAFYADFISISLALSVAAAASRRPGVPPQDGDPEPAVSARRPVVPAVSAHRPVVPAVAAALVALLPLGLSPHLIEPFPRRLFTAALARKRCVMSDAPIGLIQTNTLTRDFRHGCLNWVDVTGRLYGVDHPVGDRTRLRAYSNWNRDVTAYLTSGDAVLFVRKPEAIRINPDSLVRITRGGLIASSDGYTVYQTRRP